MQRVGAVVVLVAVGSQLGAKLASKDRGQASRGSVCLLIFISVSSSSCQFRWLAPRTLVVAQVMMIGGPRLISQPDLRASQPSR